MQTRRMTVGQLVVEFLAQQFTVDGDLRLRTIPGMLGIFGHGNVSGVGQGLHELAVRQPGLMPYYQARNEQAMVHEATAFSRVNRRRATFACTASVGPGSTNMITGAAVATTNRLPVLLLPSDTFANRVSDPVLQQLEMPHDASLSVNDSFKPVSRFFDRVHRPEQIFSSLLNAMRVLTDPVETGAVTICLPQDVQTEAIDVPMEFLAERDWIVRRPRPDAGLMASVANQIKRSKSPVIVAGGGVIYSDAHQALASLVNQTGIPVGVTQAGMGSLLADNPNLLGGIGATGTTAANRIAKDADLIIGIGTRFSDFTTASRSAFQHPEVKFININIASFDAVKHGSATPVVADARESLVELLEHLIDYHIDSDYQARIKAEIESWHDQRKNSIIDQGRDKPSQSEIIGVINSECNPDSVLISAAGSLPGDLHRLWQPLNSLGYHVEYAFSCMGYEIAAGVGIARWQSGKTPIVMVGDGSYLMMHTELVSAVAEGLKLIVVLIQNHGYASIGRLSESVGSERFGTKYRYQDKETGRFEFGNTLTVDLATNAESLGVGVIRIEPNKNALSALRQAIKSAEATDGVTLIHIESDPMVFSPENDSWWDVPIAEVSTQETVKSARKKYDQDRQKQRPLLGGGNSEKQ